MFKLTSKERMELTQPAKELLDNKAFKTALEEVSSKYIEAWGNTKVTDVETREKLHSAFQIIKYVKMHIVTYATEGELKQKNIVSDIKRG